MLQVHPGLRFADYYHASTAIPGLVSIWPHDSYSDKRRASGSPTYGNFQQTQPGSCLEPLRRRCYSRPMAHTASHHSSSILVEFGGCMCEWGRRSFSGFGERTIGLVVLPRWFVLWLLWSAGSDHQNVVSSSGKRCGITAWCTLAWISVVIYATRLDP